MPSFTGPTKSNIDGLLAFLGRAVIKIETNLLLVGSVFPSNIVGRYQVNKLFLISNIPQEYPFKDNARRKTEQILKDDNSNFSTEDDWNEEMEQTSPVSYRSRVVNAAEDILPVYGLIEG